MLTLLEDKNLFPRNLDPSASEAFLLIAVSHRDSFSLVHLSVSPYWFPRWEVLILLDDINLDHEEMRSVVPSSVLP